MAQLIDACALHWRMGVNQSEKEACEAMGVHKCSIASCYRRGYKCKGYEISKLENEMEADHG